jgi:FkbM family methyltransferase
MLLSLENLVTKYKMNIRGVLHIGAHACEELNLYNKLGVFNDRIIWVEANPRLCQNIIEANKNIIVKNFICCDTDIGYSTLHIANYGPSSSILELETHLKHHPSVQYVHDITVINKTIDTMYSQDNIPHNFANFLNIDIQGAELLALKGMKKVINNYDYICLEVNKEHLYKDCALVDEIDSFLKTFNFSRVETVWTEYNWGDALYVKDKDN